MMRMRETLSGKAVPVRDPRVEATLPHDNCSFMIGELPAKTLKETYGKVLPANPTALHAALLAISEHMKPAEQMDIDRTLVKAYNIVAPVKAEKLHEELLALSENLIRK